MQRNSSAPACRDRNCIKVLPKRNAAVKAESQEKEEDKETQVVEEWKNKKKMEKT